MSLGEPQERFDLIDADGRPLGRSKPRAEVHRDGDWHRSLHIWVVLRRGADDREGDPPAVLLQRRSASKDTWPGAIDIAVTGHLQAGETVEDALRESREEIGLSLGRADVIALGRRRRIDHSAPGTQDHEIQELLLAVVERPLRSFTPCPEELEALLAVGLVEFRRLVSGDVDAVPMVVLPSAPGQEPVARRLAATDLVLAPDGYYAAALARIEDLLAGRPTALLALG
jgi:isopentenyldiphosphate isomerase